MPDDAPNAAEAPETTTPQPTTTLEETVSQPAAKPAPTPPKPTPQTEQDQSTSLIPPATMPTDTAPTVLTPLKRHGLPGVLDEVRNWIAGTQGTQLYIDQQTGERYWQHPPLSPIQQWARVGARAFQGAAAGLAAGRGAGNQGRAVLAGIQAQQQTSQEQQQEQETEAEKGFAAARQSRIDAANDQMRQAQLTEIQLRGDRMQHDMTQGDIKFADEQNDYYRSQHGVDLGVFASDDSKGHVPFYQIAKARPDIWKDHFNDNSIKSVREPTGGVRFWYVPPDKNNEVLPEGSTFKQFIPNDDVRKPGTLKDVVATGPMSRGQKDSYDTSATLQASQDAERIAKLLQAEGEAKIKTAQANYADVMARLGVTKEEVGINYERAETARAYAERDKALSEQGDKTAQAMNLGEALVNNSVTEDMIPTMQGLKGQVMSYLAKKYPNLDQKSVFLTADDRKRQTLATSALENLDLIQASLKKDPKLLGKVQGRLSQGKTLLGTDDEQLASINEAVGNYAIATVGAHGSKSVLMKHDAEDELLNGFKNGMGATISAMDTARTSLHVFADKGQPRDLQGRPFSPTGTIPGTPSSQTSQQQLPPDAMRQLKPNVDTHFDNGQVWTIKNGVPTQVR